MTEALRRLEYGNSVNEVPWGCNPNDVLYLDIETFGVEHRWNMAPRDFFRLGQIAWGPQGDVHVTTDYDEVISAIRSCDGVVAHNAHSFDLSVLFGKDSTEPLKMTQDGRLFDTLVYATLACPAPTAYVDRAGRKRNNVAKPEMILQWLSLDNLCFQLGVDGKDGDLSDIAKKYGGYGNIPTDDPEFLAYAVQDVKALQELTTALLRMHKPTDYDWREQLSAAIDAQNARNGFRVNIPVATARVQELAERKEILLADLQHNYGFPTAGKMPWRTTAGKNAILKVLADQGITPVTRSDWTKTKTGNISLGGDTLIELTAGTDAEDVGRSLAELMGQRSLAQLALDCVQDDSFVHPEITSLQRSGRRSTTRPGLTVWTSRGKGAVEKSYFVPNNDDEILIAFDYSQADARIVAAYSGDKAFLERFTDGVDAHELTGRMVFGDDVYDTEPKKYRQLAKIQGHAWSYRASACKLASVSGQPLEIAQRFVTTMAEMYPRVIEWQNRVTAQGESGYVMNAWGRRMVVEADRSYTQSSALLGQSGTRELMVDSMIRMLEHDIRLITYIKIQVHDELVLSIPKSELYWAVPKIKECMTTVWGPHDGIGQDVLFPVSSCEPAENWMLANH
jgi:DNA polymerase-1